MAVYRNTVLHGAVEALRANYPVVEQIVGEEMFEHVAVDFATAYPPENPVLALYGVNFAGWMEDQSWSDDLPYLADVARVERLHVESLMAPDQEPLSADQASVMLRSNAQASLHASARFDWLRTPAMSIWLAHRQPFDSQIEPEWKAEGALFVRPSAFVMHTPRIGSAAHRMLSGVRIGEPLGDSVSAAERIYPQEDCNAVFASLVNLGVFVAPDRERK